MAGLPARLSLIGYEGRTLPELVETLRMSGVTVLCDVRRTPLSRKKGFSKGPLRVAVEAEGIRYEPLPELGIAPEARKKASSPAARAALFAEYERDVPGLKKPLAKLAGWLRSGERVALLCFERDPADCHRSRIPAALGIVAQDL